MTFGRKNADVAEGVSIISDSLLITAVAFVVWSSTFPPAHRPLAAAAAAAACPAERLPAADLARAPGKPIPAGNVFFWRRRGLKRKDDTDKYDEPYGPMTLGTVVLFALIAVFAAGIAKLVSNPVVTAQLAAFRR
jgi:hypothetical protein